MPGQREVSLPLKGVYEPAALPEIENVTIHVIVGDKRVELPESHPMYDVFVEEAIEAHMKDLEDEMHARADHEYDRRREG